MGVQYMSPVLYCLNVSCLPNVHSQKQVKDALVIFRYFGKIGPENDSLYLEYVSELCGRKLQWIGFDG